ncbi:Uu.00g129720.m01.CDS01 [Anthostomella pinea]|uniref:Uu.00g129720.m01.CDS01 n=1 Tax=Anthostomella pinea TaxID=933095 RepID=A0AAI8YFP5_9PEZI|nr:Uu.00g129720.m01.CDS01 [Anthostomella pinea]
MTTIPNNELQDHYAPIWLPYFDKDGRLVEGVSMRVQCHICWKVLAILHPAVLAGDRMEVDGETNEDEGDEDEGEEACVVLLCGHAFGLTCIKAWFAKAPEPNCPSCRKSMMHALCRHPIIDE